MWCKSIFNYRFVLGLSNLALSVGSFYLKSDTKKFSSSSNTFISRHFSQACGFILLAYGFALYTDTNRILLSRLIGASSDQLSHMSHPFFYYIALALAVAGLIAIFASFIGWWATCLNNYYILSIVSAALRIDRFGDKLICRSLFHKLFAVFFSGIAVAIDRV